MIVTRALAVLLFAFSLHAQAPRLGEINFYGFYRIAPEAVLRATALEENGPLPPSKGDLEDRIAEIPGVLLAHVEALCCEGPNATLFIGIEEKGAPHFALRTPPAGESTLPQEILDSYRGFLAAVQNAALRGNASEDLTAGHSTMFDPEANGFQKQFAAFAADNLDLLRDVLRNSSEPEHRAVAAAVIGYAASKATVANDLQYAINDPDPAVRANAMRALSAFAVLAAAKPGLKLRIAPTWFVEVLNSVTLSDRLESVKALNILTDAENPAALALMRERALPSLVEMARWKSLRYALPAFLLVGRIAGLPDAEAQQMWERGEREKVIQKALALPQRKGAR
jgi:hypothetical protein